MRPLTRRHLTRSRAPSSRSFSTKTVNNKANQISDQMAAAVRQSNHQSLDDLAKKFNLELGDLPLASATEPVAAFGNSQDVRTGSVPIASRRAQPANSDAARICDYHPERHPACAPGTWPKFTTACWPTTSRKNRWNSRKARRRNSPNCAKGGEAFDQGRKISESE